MKIVCINTVEVTHVNLNNESRTYIGFIKDKEYNADYDDLGNLMCLDEECVSTSINGAGLQAWFDYYFKEIKGYF